MASDSYKKLTRLYIPESEFISGESCSLSDGQAHYLRNVMRKEVGETLRVFNSEDGEWIATLEEVNKKNAVIKLNHKIHEQRKSSDIWVLASPVKKEAFDLMVQKSCELGAARFIPVICDHTVVHNTNQERLQAIAIEAAEQSERLDVMEVAPLIHLKKHLESVRNNRNLIFCIERTGKATVAGVAKELAGKPLMILVGPEGGFSIQEVELINKYTKVYPVSLGPSILKTETALISALSCIQMIG